MSKLEKALEQITKRYGNGTIIRGKETLKDIEKISTGCINLDKILDGGFPIGSITEVYGSEGVGKSTLTAHVVANAQKKGGLCVYVDTEYAVNSDYFKSIGVDMDSPDKFMLCQPVSGEDGFSIIETLLESGEVSAIVVDSVPALIPQAVLDGEIEDQTIGQLARLMSKALPRLVPKIAQSKTALIFINQLRDNIGVMGYGPKTTTTGGKALKYYSNLRLELSRTGAIKDGEEIIGATIKAKITKSKVSAPFQECIYPLIYGEGISQEYEIIEIACKKGIITKGGAWLTYKSDLGNDIKLQGIQKMVSFLKENSEITDEIKDKLIE